MSGPTSPVDDPDNRYHAPTIAEVDAKLATEHYATGLRVWRNVEDAYIETYLNGDGHFGGAQLASLDAAIRADAEVKLHADVEAWLKRRRDLYVDNDGGRLPGWFQLDDALDNLRDHYYTGTPLTQSVRGPHPGEG